jgi:hypothetical protein
MVGSAEPIVGLSASATKGKSLHLRRVVCGAKKGSAPKVPAAEDVTPTIASAPALPLALDIFVETLYPRDKPPG